MGRRSSIPVRVRRPDDHARTYRRQSEPPTVSPVEADERKHREAEPSQQGQASVPTDPKQPTTTTENESSQDSNEWRDQALRLQAEMANYRKRQKRLAEDQIQTEQRRLLGAFLGVIDDLERALASPDGDEAALRQGLELTHRAALQLMGREGAEQIEAEDQPFDPGWHEAVATVGRNGTNLASGTVAQVIEPGYRLGDQLLRPAKVIVAV